MTAGLADRVHRLLYDQFGTQTDPEELEELGEAIIALAEGYEQGQPPPSMVPAARLRSMIQLLGPGELTPTASRMLLSLCEEAESS